MKYNLNNLAVKVTKLEGKKHQVNIADTKEIIKILFSIMKAWNIIDIADTLKQK